MTGTTKILVIGDDSRSFLTIVRSLGRAGQIVHIAPSNFRSPALGSRYIAAVHRLPPYLGDGTAWLAAVIALWEAQAFDLAIPCDERSLLPFDAHRDLIEARGWRVAIPDRRAVEVLFDKHATRELATRLAVDVAPGRLLRPGDTAEGLAAEFGLPLVLKPRRSYGLDQLHARGKVVIAHDVGYLARQLERVARSDSLVEGYVAGRGVGVSVLADRGIVLQAFEHHRVHDELAVGGSYYRRSAPLSLDLNAAVELMMAALDYTGVAMVEFRRNEATGAYALLEVNARPWGSMPLPVGLGVDFPERWRRLLLDGERMPATTYEAGIYGRNLVRDLEFLMLEVKRQRSRPLSAVRTIGQWLGELVRGLVQGELSDTIVRDDVRPGLAELGGFIGYVAAKTLKRLPGVEHLNRHWARRRALRLLGRRMATGAAGRMVFVCSGNICRSPFAKKLLQARLIGPASPLQVDSAGTLPVEGREPPADAQIAAGAFGIDLVSHRSHWFDERTAATSDVVVVFDEINESATLDRYPDLAGRVVLLASLTNDGAVIADPYGHDRESFYEVYRRIDQALDRLLGLAR